MPVELVVGVLVLSVLVNLALLIALAVWASRADHVTLHWPRPLQAAADLVRPRPARNPLPGARRRTTLYVSDPPESRPSPRRSLEGSGGPNADLAAAVAAAGSRRGGTNGHGQMPAIKPTPVPGAYPLSSTLPRDLAEFLAQPAAIAPDAAGYGFIQSLESSTVRAASSGLSGPSLVARLPGPEGAAPNVAGAAVGTGSAGDVAASAGAMTIDPLTGLESPASWARIVSIENARLLRYRRPMTVIMAEVEGLRRVAERLGPEPVERLLPVIADAFAREARTSDWVARLGDSRFGVLCPETDEIQAINYVERIRLVCEPWLASSAVPLRLAIGWSSPTSSTDLEYAIRRAEERMHQDRRMPGKALLPRAGAARLLALAPDQSEAPEGQRGSGTQVPSADTGRVAQWGGIAPRPEEEETAEAAEITRARGRRRPKSGPDGDILSGS
jgi:diguanylate cyclase (GGDEF)-like protein